MKFPSQLTSCFKNRVLKYNLNIDFQFFFFNLNQ